MTKSISTENNVVGSTKHHQVYMYISSKLGALKITGFQPRAFTIPSHFPFPHWVGNSQNIGSSEPVQCCKVVTQNIGDGTSSFDTWRAWEISGAIFFLLLQLWKKLWKSTCTKIWIPTSRQKNKRLAVKSSEKHLGGWGTNLEIEELQVTTFGSIIYLQLRRTRPS